MSEYRRQIVFGGVAALIVGIIVIASVAYLPLGNTATTSSRTATNTIVSTSSTVTSNSSTTNSSLGLRLGLTLDQSSLLAGENINITVQVVNTMQSVNNVSVANNWPYPQDSLNPYDPCGAPGPLGFAIFGGYYDAANYSSAQALALYNTTYAFTCTTRVSGDYQYSFSPDSSWAVLINSGKAAYNSSLSLAFATKGYYTGGFGTTSSTAFHNFPLGSYTVLAADEWGQVAISHFVVTSQNQHTLSFDQGTVCSPGTSLYGQYFAPWSVTLTSSNGQAYNSTIVQPLGDPPPGPNSPVSGSQTNNQYAQISFVVPDGTYNYTINPSQFRPNSGIVNVNGSDVTIDVTYQVLSCGSLITTTTSQSQNTTNSATVPADCFGNTNLKIGDSIIAGNSSATLCVEYYYYDSQPTTFSPISQLSVQGVPNGSGSLFNAASNFTITSSVGQLTIGGPSNANEGALVIYTITPKAGSSGTYILNLGWLTNGIEECGQEFLLVSGSGIPNYTYTYGAGCITMTSSGTLSYPYPAGTIFTKVIGATNSTA